VEGSTTIQCISWLDKSTTLRGPQTTRKERKMDRKELVSGFLTLVFNDEKLSTPVYLEDIKSEAERSEVLRDKG
jgi:hypothetical protein